MHYSYDSLYRLTNETISGSSSQNGTISYVYDPAGNRQSMSSTVPAIPAGTFFYDANDRSGTDVYDNDGNTVGHGALNYVYDFENHLVQQGGASFVYDGDGNRVQKIVAGNVTHYFVDSVNPSGYPQVLAEETASNFAFTNYTWGLELISRVDFSSGQPIYFLHDGHGSVRALTNPSGAVTDTYDYDAFGNLLHSTGTTPNNYLFAGQQFDPNLNLYYNRARYLNVPIGRFWTMDVFEGFDEEPLSLHKYLYAEADPVDNTDTTGGEIDEVIGAFAASDSINAMSTPHFNQIISTIKPEALYIRAFAPWKAFGGAFAGVTTSRSPGVTSRTTGVVTFLLPSAVPFSAWAYSDPSRNVLTGATATGLPTISTQGSSAGHLHVETAGHLPLIPFSPDIDVKLDMSVTASSNQVCYAGRLSGDAFPDVEVFVVNQEDQATMLDTFSTTGGRATGPLFRLPGDNNRPMGSFSKCASQ